MQDCGKSIADALALQQSSVKASLPDKTPRVLICCPAGWDMGCLILELIDSFILYNSDDWLMEVCGGCSDEGAVSSWKKKDEERKLELERRLQEAEER